MSESTLPDSLAEIRDEFLELDESDRLQLLLEFSNELPPVPERYEGHPELTERVAECQSPVYIVVDVEGGEVAMHATAPAEAPTTRGFASILAQYRQRYLLSFTPSGVAGDGWHRLEVRLRSRSGTVVAREGYMARLQ